MKDILSEKQYPTPSGIIHYFTNEIRPERRALVFLPGLTADHRLFEKQIPFFANRYNILVWDAPGHAFSRPFSLDFALSDKARWLHEILSAEGIRQPILVGQSMGGYVSQMYLELFPGEVDRFVSIDSAPLKRKYMTSAELWLLSRMEPMYRLYPWKALIKAGSDGVADTTYGKKLMHQMMQQYSPKEYAALAGHGYRMLANAVALNRPYEIPCPCILICGEHDRAGSAKSYNKRWAKTEGLTIHWIPNAGHNSNTDCPDEINQIIEDFCQQKTGNT